MTIWTDFLGSTIGWVDVDGIPTRVLEAGGGGPTVVLIHGRGGHLESWRANVRPLAASHRVVAFDLLGHGLTGQADVAYSIEDLTRHAIAVLDTLGVGDATLVGQSIGAWIAARIGASRPDLAAALVLLEPAGLESESERLARPKVAAAYARGGEAFEAPTAETVRTRLEGLVADPSSIDDEMVAVRLALYEPAAARAVHKAVRAADNSDSLLTREALAALEPPVAVVHGALANTPTAVVEAAAEAAGAVAVTVPDVKQWPQLEAADLVNRLISDQSDA